MFLSTKVHNRVPKVTEGSLNIKTTLLNMITYLGILCQFLGLSFVLACPQQKDSCFAQEGYIFIVCIEEKHIVDCLYP